MKKRIIMQVLAGLVIIAVPGRAQEKGGPSGWEKAYDIIEQITEPVFPSFSVMITETGAVEGGSEDCSKAISKALRNVSQNGGGTVIVPAGTFLTGPIRMESNVRIHLEEGAELLFSTDPDDYLPVVLTRWEGIDCYNYQPLVYARDAENIAITGKGVLNGMADNEHWWPWKGRTEYGYKQGMPSQLDPSGQPRLKEYNEEQAPVDQRIFGRGGHLRPQFIHFYNCRNILLEDITIINAPFWLIHPLFSENMVMRRVTMESNGPNNDGCDPESSRNILIEDCFFNTGDDCIAIKSGRNQDGRRWDRPGENIVIRNCTMHNGHGGVVIGSEISGGARNIFAEDCIMDSPNLERAIRIKTNTNRGGIIENIYVRNIQIGQVEEAVLRINCHYDVRREGTGEYMPEVRNIHLQELTSDRSEYALMLEGLEGLRSIDGVYLIDCIFDGVEKGSVIEYVTDLHLEGTRINGESVRNLVDIR